MSKTPMNVSFTTEQSAAIIINPAQALAREFMILKEQGAFEFELVAWRKRVKERYGRNSSRYLEEARLIAIGGDYRC